MVLVPLSAVGEAEHFLRGVVSDALLILLGQQEHQQLLQLSILLSLVLLHPPDYRVVFLQQALVLLDEVPAQLLQVLLVVSQLLDLPSNRDLIVLVGIEFHLLILFLFDFPGDALEEVPGACLEVLVHVDVFPLVVAYFFEAVHVELPDEGGEIAMLEVDGEDILGEAGDALDGEGVSGGSP
jgi:hypothetical protein